MKTIKRLLISQPKPFSEHNPYAELETQFGVQCDFFQLMHIEGLDAHEFRQQRINPLDYTAIIFSSRQAIDHFFRLCEEMRLQVPESMHYYCINDTVGNYLQRYIQYRKRKVFPSPTNRFEDLLPAMHRRPSEKYLMVTSENHSEEVIQMFANNNVIVKPAVMYRSVSTSWPKDKPFEYDLIALFTPQGVLSIRENFPNWDQGDTLLACMGQNTAQAIADAGFRVDIQASTSLPAAIANYLEKNKG